MDIKPIETEYNGYRFRSRLEARWAVFFDTTGIQYEYEPEGFFLRSGKKYLPDFYLPDQNAYVEIKSAGALDIDVNINTYEVHFNDGREDVGKYASFICEAVLAGYSVIVLQGDPIDVATQKRNRAGSGYVFTMGQCPICDKNVPIAYPFVGIVENKLLAIGDYRNECVIPKDEQHWCMVIWDFKKNEYDYVCCEPEHVKQSAIAFLSAAKKARQARFEFGEKG